MENNFNNNLRVFLFNELNKIASLPGETEVLTEIDLENKIYSMEKIVKMLKESLNLIDDEIEKDKSHFKSVSEEQSNELPF